MLCRQVAGPPLGFPTAGGTFLAPPLPEIASVTGTSSATTTSGLGSLDLPGGLPSRGLSVRTSSRGTLAEAPKHTGSGGETGADPHAAAAAGGLEALSAVAAVGGSDGEAHDRSRSCDIQRQSGVPIHKPIQ